MVVKTCGNCKNERKWFDEEPCEDCWPLDGFSHWEAKEDEAPV